MIRRLTVAVAIVGNTFCFGEPCSMVGAIVVCNVAAPCGVALSSRRSRGSNSQLFAIAARVTIGACGAMASSMSRVTPA
jgi:hypothetical protein